MKRYVFLTLTGLALFFGSALVGHAEVKRVEIQVTGFLCNY